MSEEPPADIVELAERYLECLEGDEVAEDDPGSVNEEFEYWQEQVDEFKEGTAMYEMAIEERDEWKERVEAIEARGERSEKLRTELLTQASTEFAPQGDWLKTPVMKALSHAFHGQQRERLFVGDHCLPDDQEDMSKRDMVDTAKTVQALARDAIGDEDVITDVWNTLDTDTRLAIARGLYKNQDPVSSGQLGDQLGEEGPNDPGANIRMLRGENDIEPFHGSDRGYTLTLAGRYALSKLGPEKLASEDGSDENGHSTRGDFKDSSEADEAQDIVSDEEERDDTEAERSDGEQGSSDEGVDLSSFEVKEQ